MYAEEENENYEQKPNTILEFLEKNVKFTLEEILEKNQQIRLYLNGFLIWV